jgi:hypothetical protein
MKPSELAEIRKVQAVAEAIGTRSIEPDEQVLLDKWMPVNVSATLLAEVDRLRTALEHIAAKESWKDCCKFSALNGYRRRHLKEVAREALNGG